MKRFFIPLLAAAALAVSSSAIAAVPLTNIVQNINIALSYTSPILYGNPPIDATNWNVTRKINGRETNFVNIAVSKAATNIIVTKDIIQALLPGAPPASSLVLVHFTNNAGTEVQIRSGGVNLLTVSTLTVVENQSYANSRTVTTTTTITNLGTEKIPPSLTTRVTATTSENDIKLVTISLVNASIGFQLTGVESSTLVPVIVGGKVFTTHQEIMTPLVGTGNDTRGQNEIVQGTITVGPPHAGF